MSTTYISDLEKVLDTTEKRYNNSKKHTEQRLYIPSGLNTRSLLDKKEQKHVDKYNYLLHHLYMTRVLNRKYSDYDFIPVRLKTLREYVSKRKADTIIQFWLDHHVIESDNSYIIGQKSTGFRLTEDFRDIKAVDVGIVDEVFTQRLKTLRKRYNDQLDMSLPQHAFLNYNLHEIKVDATAAFEYLIETALDSNYTVPAKATKKEKLSIEAARKKALNKYNKDVASIMAISTGSFRINRDTTGKRVHHNIANLSKRVRRFLYLASGEPLVNVDVKNSQPLIMCILLLEKYQRSTMPADMVAYIKECEQGTLYTTLMAAFNTPDLDRSAFKQNLFKSVYYGENKYADNYTEWKTFNQLYPSVGEFITNYKRKNFEQLSIDMQRAESEIIIDGVIASLAAKYKHMFFSLTIHDSVMCKAVDQDEVRDLILYHFGLRGLTPSVAIENI
ncbi:hypothetical protein [Hymenobacter sublimis]|uniref:DNA-directed DNA polymerase family A palm domain-containing protein n=1 Tax=Hymenobacter sublimis TaxID=2933777 RepID=A0ABY4JCK9_9BACT|nr:hypothetical protein [Hymenobacter sublimis]UPL50544.1 hypothetical protein MWH26_06455 [Hymenobacter sublimis]